MLASRLDLDGASVLDLFAGSGALGIEALSRGAAHCVFVERDRSVKSVLLENVRACDFIRRAEVLVRPVQRALRDLGERGARFDVVLMDAPYADGGIDGVLDELSRRALVAESGFIVVEHDAAKTLEDVPALRLTRTQRYGNTCVSLLTPTATERGKSS